MNMTLSKRGDYVMRSAISLARAYERGESRKLREVVADTDVPKTFASQILADLVRSDLAVSKAGRDGGYRLTRPPHEISVLEVIEAGEGPLRSERCALGDGPCRWEAVCPLHETWSHATVALRELLSRTNLEQVAERDAAIEAGTYAVPHDAHRLHPLTIDVADAVQVELGLPALDLAITRVSARALAALAADWLTSVSGASSRSRRKPGPVTEASIAPVAPTTEDPDTAQAPTRYLLSLQLGSPLPAARLEAEMLASPVDAERTELGVEGTWHQVSADGKLLTGRELEAQARPIVRAFLRGLARTLEEGPGGHQSRAMAPSRSVR
ncbi:MAG: RrF2 family transcriptional regulator [Acidimicrobiales bacterium]